MRYNKLITDLSDKTSDAYARNWFNEGSWKSIIHRLLCFGYEETAIEEILRSKHMRWSSQERNISANKFSVYLIANNNGILDDFPMPKVSTSE